MDFRYIDIDECTLGISGCSQLCQNTYGSFLCGCLTGYTLMPDKNTCLGEFETWFKSIILYRCLQQSNRLFMCYVFDCFVMSN